MEQMATIGLDTARSFKYTVLERTALSSFSGVCDDHRCWASSQNNRHASLALKPARVRIFWAREIGALGHDVRLMPGA